MTDTNKFAIVIEDEEIRLVTLNEDVSRPWDLTKKILGDVNLEVVSLGKPWGNFCGLIHEDGKAEGLPENKFATELCKRWLHPNDYIAGPMTLCCNNENLDGLAKNIFEHYDFFMTVASVYLTNNQQHQNNAAGVSFRENF